MFDKIRQNSDVLSRILINFPTNIGDAIMCLPALDIVKANFSRSEITAIVSSRTFGLIERHSFIDSVILYNKRWPLRDKIKFMKSFKTIYDIFIDFKNSFLPVMIHSSIRTPFFRNFPSDLHNKDRYIKLLDSFADTGKKPKRGEFILKEEEISGLDKFKAARSVFICLSSRSELKAYPRDYIARLMEGLSAKYYLTVIGDNDDRGYYGSTLKMGKVNDLAGKTSLVDVYYLLKNYADLVLCVDSSILHLASYLNLPIVSMFGPTSHHEYGPWSEKSEVIVNDKVLCRPCRSSQCRYNLECMKTISPDEVIRKTNSYFSDKFVS